MPSDLCSDSLNSSARWITDRNYAYRTWEESVIRETYAAYGYPLPVFKETMWAYVYASIVCMFQSVPCTELSDYMSDTDEFQHYSWPALLYLAELWLSAHRIKVQPHLYAFDSNNFRYHLPKEMYAHTMDSPVVLGQTGTEGVLAKT